MRQIMLMIAAVVIVSTGADTFAQPRRHAERNARPRSVSRHHGASQQQTTAAVQNETPQPRIAAGTAVDTQDQNSISPRIINGTPTSSFASVGIVGSIQYGQFGGGTLIAARYVLTAGHVGDFISGDTFGTFDINGQTYGTSRVYVHPGFNSFSLANDIAVLELDQDVNGVTPSPIYRNAPQKNEILTIVGYGAGGDGNTGQDGSFGVKMVGTTPIDIVTPTLIGWNFQNNNESNTAPGDSGGPGFLFVNNVYYVAGVTSYGTKADASIGDTSYDTRVDVYKNWIDSIVNGGGGSGGGSGSGAACALEAAALQMLDLALPLCTENLRQAALNDVRRFRDQVLAKSAYGPELIRMYYECSPQLTRIMRENPALVRRTLELVTQAFPALKQATTSGRPLVLEPETFARGIDLIDAYVAVADQGLARDLLKVKAYLTAAHSPYENRVAIDFSASETPSTAGRMPPEWNGGWRMARLSFKGHDPAAAVAWK